MNAPKYIQDHPRARQIFKEVAKHIEESSKADPVDSTVVAMYAYTLARYEELTLFLMEEGETYKDKNGDERRRPETIRQQAMVDQATKLALSLGINRAFREKGREKNSNKERPADRAGSLRKVG